MGKIVAIDFGLKRTGIAITDELCIIASPLTTIASAELMPFLIKLVASEVIDTIVLGEPKRLDGSDTHISENIRILRTVLMKQFPNIPIEMMDERFTSKMASQSISSGGLKKSKREDKSLIDMVSAAIILQSYLDRLR